MAPSRRIAPVENEQKPRRPTRIAPTCTPGPDAARQPRWLQDTPAAASPDGPASPDRPRWLQDTPDAPRHDDDDDDATLDRPATPPDWISPDRPEAQSRVEDFSDDEDGDPYTTPANYHGPDSDDDDLRLVSPSPSPQGVDAAVDEDESDGPGEHMAVLFELLPFYRQGDASTDAVVTRAVSATLVDDLRAVDDDGATPLVVCAQYGHEDLVEALLERGADVDAAAHSGCTALVYACGASQGSFSERLVETLLDHGADPNIPELHHGSRALHYLAATGHERLCRELVMRGADATAKDFIGWAPADYAADAEHADCAAVLRQLAQPPQTPKTPLKAAPPPTTPHRAAPPPTTPHQAAPPPTTQHQDPSTTPHRAVQPPTTPHQADHLAREVEKRTVVESALKGAQDARRDAETDLDDALRRVDVLEAEAVSLRRRCDDQARDVAAARETGASRVQDVKGASAARIAQLESELGDVRASHARAAQAHATTASSQNDAARKAVEALTATFEGQHAHLEDARTNVETQLAVALDGHEASNAAHFALLNELRGEAAAAVRDRDALQKSSERQVLNAERRCELAEKVSAVTRRVF